jgi:hypothetical protein
LGGGVGVDVCHDRDGIGREAKVMHDAKKVSMANGVEGAAEVDVECVNVLVVGSCVFKSVEEAL